ncbi:hypothetical protein MMC07_004989 [Pseudocyphellaria aurata]|nr:hypothetical protein [Pseudocyphellaria aurata]
MADPFSIAGTATGLISLGIQITHSLVEFYKSYKSQDLTLAGTVERLEWLSENFQCLQKTLSARNVQTEEQSLIETSIQKCDELIQELQTECQKFRKTSLDGSIAAVRVARRRAAYPFRESTLKKLDESIAEILHNLSFALNVLQLKDLRNTQDNIAEVKILLISSYLRDWLKAPNATVDHNAACAKSYPETGMWLVESPAFSNWLTEQNSILWLNGFAGSGKSVLCSTVIQFALRNRASDPRVAVAVAYFYFTFSDESKRDESGMLRALLLQLAAQLQDGETELNRLYQSYNFGVPTSRVLLEYLRRLFQRFHHVRIVLDGLDESPRDDLRERVLDTLNSMRNWGFPGLHLFVTSRDEPDIRDSLNLFTQQQVSMRNLGIDRDIADYISGRLENDLRLKKWLLHRDKIQKILTQRANGV